MRSAESPGFQPQQSDELRSPDLHSESSPPYILVLGIGATGLSLSYRLPDFADADSWFAWPGSSQMPTAARDGQTRFLDDCTVSSDTTHICIIGGGVSGLSALQVIMETPQYKSSKWRPILFEARDKTGGIWLVCYSATHFDQRKTTTPRTQVSIFSRHSRSATLANL